MGKYIEGCNLCQRIKDRTEVLAEKLMTNEVLEKLWMHLILDLITKLLLVADKDIILVVYDRLSNMAYFVATTEEKLIKELVRLFLNPNTEEFRRSELLGKYIAKILFGWDDRKFENEYLKKL